MHSESKQTKRKKQSANRKMRNHFHQKLAFTEIFRNIYPENIMSSAVLLNRGINFYLLVLVSGIITIISHMNSEKIENQEEK